MQKLDPKVHGRSPDFVAENVARLKELFPEAFTEDKVDVDALRQLLGDYAEDRVERYGLNWAGKSRARQIAQTPSSGTLRPAPDESVEWDTTQNVFIEGDNLEVLKLLQKSYHRRVKMIYIDPPYNTGKEFIYPDRYQDNLDTYLRYTGQVDGEGLKLTANAETNGRYHTNWLNMMYPRLKLARNLLRDDGVIFVSIDDHEVQNLRHLMDEVFGPENFVAHIVWLRKYGASNNAKGVAPMVDYLLCYQRSDGFSPGLFPRSGEAVDRYSNPDNDPRGPWKPVDYWNPLSPADRPNLAYTITNPHTGQEIVPTKKAWKYSRERYQEQEADGRIYWGRDGANTVPALKRFLSEVRDGVVPTNFWDWKFAGHTDSAKKELEARLGPGGFDTPKPTLLIRRMCELAQLQSGDVVLDFFAGSGATGDAVMQLNAEDGGNRRFVLVQLPEKTDASDYPTIAEITKARLRAAAEAIAEESKDSLPGMDQSEGVDLGFRVFKLDSTNIKPWDGDFDNLEPNLLAAVDNIKPGRSEDDVLYELLLKYGLDLSLPIDERIVEDKRVFILGAGALVVCLAADVTLSVVEGIGALKAELQPEVMRVVFRDASFKDDVTKTNAVQILKRAGIDDIKSL